MEIWDGYLNDGTLANQDLVRGEPIPKGLYHLVSEILVRHVDGDYLLTRRDIRKNIKMSVAVCNTHFNVFSSCSFILSKLSWLIICSILQASFCAVSSLTPSDIRYFVSVV